MVGNAWVDGRVIADEEKVMAPVAVEQKRKFGPGSSGILMPPSEFDQADFVEGWRYELVNGVLIVSPVPSMKENDPNQELGHWLLTYRDQHPKGSALDHTAHEWEVKTRNTRRRADRVIWAGLGRLPRRNETPTIIVEFVSSGKRNRERDYEAKRKEYRAIRVKEYWIIDRFERTLTVFSAMAGKSPKVIRENQTYKTELLPGFELPLAPLLALADRWPEEDESADL
jgi:Uma2 family endonuclease